MNREKSFRAPEMAICVIAAYIAAQILADIGTLKIALVGGFNIDGGTFIYPLTFTLRDMVHKLLGRRAAQTVILAAGVINPAGANAPVLTWVFDSLVAPGQMAIFALLVFFMAAAAYRFLRINRPGGAWMLAGALIVLVAQWPLATQWLPPAFAAATFWLLDAPVMAALRGLLLGSGIALLVIGLRLVLGKA